MSIQPRDLLHGSIERHQRELRASLGDALVDEALRHEQAANRAALEGRSPFDILTRLSRVPLKVQAEVYQLLQAEEALISIESTD